MALKGNPFDRDIIRPPLPTTGPRIKPKFEKIELGTVPTKEDIEDKNTLETTENLQLEAKKTSNKLATNRQQTLLVVVVIYY